MSVVPEQKEKDVKEVKEEKSSYGKDGDKKKLSSRKESRTRRTKA